MGFLVVIYVPLVLVAWVKVGPVAGVAATVWFVFMVFVTNQPGASLFGSGPYASKRPGRRAKRTTREDAPRRRRP